MVLFSTNLPTYSKIGFNKLTFQTFSNTLISYPKSLILSGIYEHQTQVSRFVNFSKLRPLYFIMDSVQDKNQLCRRDKKLSSILVYFYLVDLLESYWMVGKWTKRKPNKLPIHTSLASRDVGLTEEMTHPEPPKTLSMR